VQNNTLHLGKNEQNLNGTHLMPSYTLRCLDCENVFDVLCRYDARPEQKCTKCESINHESLITGAPALGDSVRLGVTKPDGGFKEVLSKIHSQNYKSNLADKLSRR
jgi:phage FluMu protein Com